MSKTTLIIKREYLTRVRKKSFIISTIMFPLLYVALIFGSSYFAARSSKVLNVAIVDSSGYFNKGLVERSNQLDSSSKLSYFPASDSALVNNYESRGFDGVIVIPPTDWQRGGSNIAMRTQKTHGISAVMSVNSKINGIWDEIKAEKLGIDESKQQVLDQSKISIRQENEKDRTSNANVASMIGYVCGFLIYFILIIYGSQVMMGVMEEKTNRIAEVVISSVRPFQLMLGKIVGIGLVALTQFFLWIAFIFLIYNLTISASQSNDMVSGVVGSMQNMFGALNVPLIIFCFAFYLLGGFFFYSSLYAAIGSTVNEDMREAQSLAFPVTMLVIFSILMMTAAMNDPTGPIAFWGSIIPISSPIVMMARIPFGVPGTVPWWQLLLSMGLLVAGFLFTTWLSGKIYRTGILMTGKKASWKEMMKWVFRKS